MVERDGVQGRPPAGLMFVVLLQGVNMKGRIANRKIVLEYRSGYMRIIESLTALFKLSLSRFPRPLANRTMPSSPHRIPDL